MTYRMMMHSSQSHLVAVLLAAAVLLAGCDSFVDKSPISNPSKEVFFDNEGAFETALNGAYDALQSDGTFYRSYWILFEIRSDNTDQGQDVTGLSQQLFLINQFQETTTNEIVQEAWLDSYDGIERANVILDEVGSFDGDPAFTDRVRGEALFLRSLFYYHLAVGWGNVTLKTSSTTGPDEAADATGQVPAEEVYAQIASDLETAQGLLPDSYTGPQVGKATSGAANALLGKVYLTMGQPADAETALRRVVDSGAYRLLDDYGDLWGPENENTAESIFEVQFTAGVGGEGSGYTNFFSPAASLQTGEGVARNRPTEPMVNAYFDLDGERFTASMDTSYVGSEGQDIDARYVTKYESDPFANFDAENNWVVLRYADVLLMLAEAIGPSDEAWDLVDQVRSRAGLAPVPRDNFFERLLRERRVELAFENHRWPDLKRFNQYISGVTRDRLSQEVDDLSGFNLLYPIPQREVDVAGLTQNDGY
jgi:hypothetical protein